MQTVTLEVPPFVEADEVQQLVLVALFGQGRISSGKAAELLNIPQADFLTQVGNYGISVFSDDEENLENALLQ